MKTNALFLLLCMSCLAGFTQTYRVTFTGAGEARQIDWITATNLNSGVSVTITGSEILYLRVINPGLTGVVSTALESQGGMVYPNPFTGNANLVVDVGWSQQIDVLVRNLAGQVIARSHDFIQAGANEFSISVAKAGIYFITATTEQGTSGYKVICTNPEGKESAIEFKGASATSEKISDHGLKSGRIIKPLDIQNGDIVLYRCTSGPMTTLMTDSPNASMNFQVKFAKCTDPDGKYYPVINAGDHYWMAQNLAWLPRVNRPDEGSSVSPDYYVYGFSGTDTRLAQTLDTYKEYGVLYNWEAARTACPAGWRLPSDQDWQKLERSLGMNTDEALKSGWRHSGEVGGQLKEPGTTHWNVADVTVGKLSGFYALPAGYLPIEIDAVIDGRKSGTITGGTQMIGFNRLGYCSFYWSSTASDDQSAWYRRLGCSENGVERNSGMKSYGYSVRCIRDVLMDH